MQERCFFCVSWFKAWNLEILGGRKFGKPLEDPIACTELPSAPEDFSVPDLAPADRKI